MRYEAQHKGKGRWQVWDTVEERKMNDGWLTREEAQNKANLICPAPSFQPEGQDAAPEPTQKEGVTPTQINSETPSPTPSAKDIGQSIVDHCLTLYAWKPQDWRRIQTAFQYAQRLGGYWGRQTRT